MNTYNVQGHCPEDKRKHSYSIWHSQKFRWHVIAISAPYLIQPVPFCTLSYIIRHAPKCSSVKVASSAGQLLSRPEEDARPQQQPQPFTPLVQVLRQVLKETEWARHRQGRVLQAFVSISPSFRDEGQRGRSGFQSLGPRYPASNPCQMCWEIWPDLILLPQHHSPFTVRHGHL